MKLLQIVIIGMKNLILKNDKTGCRPSLEFNTVTQKKAYYNKIFAYATGLT
jgi:hypothetical protein